MSALVRAVQRLRADLWRADLRRLPVRRRVALGALRVADHVARSSSHNLVGLQAGGLTMLTMLALVPMLALLSALGKALGYADRLDEQIVVWQGRFPAEMASMFEWVRARIATVDFRALGLLGSLFVAWSGLALFTQLERALNRIWRRTTSRALYRRISDFVALTVLVPPLAILAFIAASVLGGVELSAWLRQQSEWLEWVYRGGLGFVPHVLAWIALTALYRIMPSAAVQWRCALAGGVAAGSVLVLVHGMFLRLNLGVANANAIYLTFAALPLLLVYLQVLWTVVLAGAELAYAVQNLGSLRGGERLPPAGHAVRVRLAFHLVAAAADAFRRGERGVRAEELCAALDVPSEWLDEVAVRLLRSGVLVRTDEGARLMPARPVEQLDMRLVVAALDGGDESEIERVRLADARECELAAATAAAREHLAKLRFDSDAAAPDRGPLP